VLKQSKDKEQVQAILHGDERDMKRFFDEYFPRIYRFAIERVSGEPQVAREVVQNTLTKVLQNIHRFRGESSLFTWICSICNNEISDYKKKQARFNQAITLQGSPLDLDAVSDVEAASSPDRPDEVYDREQKARSIHRTLDSLPATYGNVIEWKYVDGLSVEQIAERLGLGHSAAQSMLYRARMAFQALHREPVK
jgi:RNA polymerase sigma-70 factor (ECF subfamily)